MMTKTPSPTALIIAHRAHSLGDGTSAAHEVPVPPGPEHPEPPPPGDPRPPTEPEPGPGPVSRFRGSAFCK